MNRRKFLSQSGQLCLGARLAPRMFNGSAMAQDNQRRALSFSNEWIESVVVTAVREMAVEDAIVVNLSATPLHYTAGSNHGIIVPWKSTMLRQCMLDAGETAALLHVRQRTNLRDSHTTRSSPSLRIAASAIPGTAIMRTPIASGWRLSCTRSEVSTSLVCSAASSRTRNFTAVYDKRFVI